MTFNPNIPQANDDPTASQTDLLGNFGKLNTDWQINHVPLTSGGNNGFHKMIQFPNVLSVNPTLTGLQSQVYPKTGFDGNPALFFANSAKVFQLTNLPVVNAATDYGIVTPFGFTINAGSIASGTTAVTFAIPFVSTIYTVELTAKGTTGLTNYTVATVSTTGFTLTTQAPSAFYYIAIGK